MEAVAIATATNAVKNSSNCSNTNTNSNSSSSSSSGYGSATTTPLSHYETTTQHAVTAAAAAAEVATPPPTQPAQSQQPAAAQTVATVAPYAYSSDSVLSAADTQQQQQQRQHYQYTTSPYGYQPAAPAATLQTLYSQHDPYVGLNYTQHAAVALDYNSTNDLALRERLQHSSNNSYTNNNVAHSPIEKLAAYANLTASSAHHVVGNTPYKPATDTTASSNTSSEIATSTLTTKPQATATPFYAAPRAPAVASAASYYEQYKFKMPTTAVPAAADYTNYGYRVPPSSATSYQQQHQQYYAAAKSQLSQSEANYMAATKSSLSPTAGSVARQQMNSFYGRANLYYDKYDKFAATAYPTTPNTATSQLTNLTAANTATYPATHPNPPHYVTENALTSPESYRKTAIAPSQPASSWTWNMDYSAAATGNCRTLPPPLTSSIPTAAIPPSNASSSFLPPSGAAASTTRDVYYNSVGSSGSSTKYDKYNAYAYHQQQQQQATAALPQRNMWSTATHERLPHVSHHSTHQPLPPPTAYPPHLYATQTRQNCCSQLPPYQHQPQPQQNCYYSRLPPQHVASSAYTQQHPHHMQQQLAPQHYGSNKYASNIYAPDYPQNKLKYPNDLIATSPYETSTYAGYNYAAAATTQRYQQATQPHHNITSDAAAAAAYYNDLNLQSTAYEGYATTVQQQQPQQPQHPHPLQQQPTQQQLHVQPRPQQHLGYHQQPSSSSSSSSHYIKNPLLDYRKPSSLSLAAPTATPVMPSAADADFYMHESSNVGATYHNFDSVSNVSLYESSANVGESVADKLNAANKNLSLRDFLATWNDDEDDAAAAAAELSFAEASSTSSADNQVTIIQTETIPAMPVTAHYLQETPVSRQTPTPENPNHQFKDGFEAAVPKIHVGISVDSNLEAQYINLPDIVIDIEKSSNVASVANVAVAAPTFEDFDVEKELDELQIKRSKLSSEQHTVTDYSTMNVATTEPKNLPETGSYQQTRMDEDEPQHVALLADTEKSRNVVQRDAATEQKLEACAIREENVATDQLSKDLECDNSSLSNESTFEKEYETFINKLGTDVEAPSREKFREASVIMSSASLTLEAEDLSTTQKPATDPNNENNEKDANHSVEQHKYSKFYKRKRKLIDDVASIETTKAEEQQPLNSTDVTPVAAEKFPPSEEQNFPLAYTKTCRKRKMLTATCVPNADNKKRLKHDARRGNIVDKAKICLTRRRKPKSMYYKILHQLSLKKLQARCRLLQHVAKLRERHLPLIKRQSIKRYAAANSRQRPAAFNPQSLKCLSVSTLNTENFRQHFLAILKDNKLQKRVGLSNVANKEANIVVNKTVAEEFIKNKLDEEVKIYECENSKSNIVEDDKNVAIVDKDLENDIPNSVTQKTELPKTDIQEHAYEDEAQKSNTHIDVEDYADEENKDIPTNDQHVTEENLKRAVESSQSPSNENEVIAEQACESQDHAETDINRDDIENCKTQSKDLRESYSELYDIKENRASINVSECKNDFEIVKNNESNNDIENETSNKNDHALKSDEEANKALNNNNSTRNKNEEKLVACVQNSHDDGTLSHDATKIVANSAAETEATFNDTKADYEKNDEVDSGDDDDDDESSSSDNAESTDTDDESSADEHEPNKKTADHIKNNNERKEGNAIVLEESNEKESRTDQVHEHDDNIRTRAATVPSDLNNFKEDVEKEKEKIDTSFTTDFQKQESESESILNENDVKNEERISSNTENQLDEASNDVSGDVCQSFERKIITETDTDERIHENYKENNDENDVDQAFDSSGIELTQKFMPKIDVKKNALENVVELPDSPESPSPIHDSSEQNFAKISFTPFDKESSSPIHDSSDKNFAKNSFTPSERESSSQTHDSSDQNCSKIAFMPFEKDVEVTELDSEKTTYAREENFSRSPEQGTISTEGPSTASKSPKQENISTESPSSPCDKYDEQLSPENLNELDQVDVDIDPEVTQNTVVSRVNRLVAYEDTSDDISDDLEAEETENKNNEMIHSETDQDVAIVNHVDDDCDTENTENEKKLRLGLFTKRDEVRNTKIQNIRSDTLDETSNSSSSSSSSSESDSSSSSDETTTSNSSSSTSTNSTTKTTTSEESVDGFNEMIALERELSTHYEAVKTYDETRLVDEMEQKINQEAKIEVDQKTTSTATITKNDIDSLKKVLEGAEEEEEEKKDGEKEKSKEAAAKQLNLEDNFNEHYLDQMEIKNTATLNEAAVVEELNHKVQAIENYVEKMEKSTSLTESVETNEILNSTILNEVAATEELNHKVAIIENYLEKMESSVTLTEAAVAKENLSQQHDDDVENCLEKMENSSIITKAAAEELSHKVAAIENYLQKMENSINITEAAKAELTSSTEVEVIENYLEKTESSKEAEELRPKDEVIENSTDADLNHKVAVIENYLEKMENSVILTENEEELSAVIEKPITRNEVEEMLLAAFESAVKEADVLERLEGGVQLMLPCTAMEISHPTTDQFQNSTIENIEEMNQVVNFTIPKLSDLCKNALNSSCKRSESIKYTTVDQDQQQANVDHYKHVGDGLEETRELSVEEALAEMYRQAGVASDPEDFDTDDDNDKQAQEVLLINLEEILVSDSDNLYVLQCDINENILGVIATQTVDRSNTENDENVNDEVAVENADDDDDAGVNAIELIELFNASDVLDVTNPTNDDNTSANDLDNNQALHIKFLHTPASPPPTTTTTLALDPIVPNNADLVPANISTTNKTTNTTKILPPASGGVENEVEDALQHHHDVNDFYDDNDFDLPTIHHEEIVPDNYKNYHKEKFLKYLHAKYVQRNITKFYHSNRVIKKYKKRLVQNLLNALAERKRHGQ